MWVARSSGSSTILAPASTRRIPSSMSSIIGSAVLVESKPPLSWKASRRIAPSPAQNEYVGPGGSLVHVVVEEVAEVGDHAVHRRRVVVGAEHGGQLGIGGEGVADAAEDIGVHGDVGVHEHEDVPGRRERAGVAGGRRPLALAAPRSR